ncbi:MAG: sensor histidine kinase KdpD [Ignavibacteriae bacterium]|nr:sensor histidine kinase KdpD [Ignavibacteriota bacterium]
MEEQSRLNPDELLARIKLNEQKEKKGKLKIYIGMCAGVGKTFSMLQDASKAGGRGTDVLIGYVETHGRAETEFLLFHLPQLPRKKIEYKGFVLEEMDIDTILDKRPKLVVVDELAHTNAPGSRHNKRYLDVIELIENGIDVLTAVNVQHIESLADTVSKITGVIISETVPDSILDAADEIELIDISPDELIQRLNDGKVYTADKTKNAVDNFFRKGNLSALREMALRLAADRVDKQVRYYMQENRIPGPWKSTQRILIGIGPSPNSADLVRWARRIAYTMEASWIAVNVETSHPLDEKQKKLLNKNLELAKELGAEVITTSDTDIVKGIIRVAKNENATHIVIGKSQNKGFFPRLFQKDIVDRILTESGQIDVYVVSGDNYENKTGKIFAFPKLQSGFYKYLSSSLIVIFVAAICYPFSDTLGYQTVALILLFVVSMLPLIFGPGPVLLSAILSPVLWNYFFVPPKFTLFISRTEDILMFIMFLIIATVTGILTTKIRQREKSVLLREERAVALYNLADDLSKSKDLDEVIGQSVKNLNKVFNSEVIFLLLDSKTKKLVFTNPEMSSISEKEFSVAQWVFTNRKKAGHYTESLPFAEFIYYPLLGPRDIYGVVGIKMEDDILYREKETLIDNFIKQSGAAVEREILNKTANKALLLEESEKLYKTLFDSISHELKIPIAAIMGASSYLLQSDSEINETQKQLLNEVHTATIRLNRLVENLLDMARLESGMLVPNIKECDINDLFSVVLDYFEKEKSSHDISVEVQEYFPFINIDFTLIETALKNLIHNALRYAVPNPKISIQAFFDDKNIYITISDNGKGIPEEHLEHIFDKFYRVDNKISGGTGLGLSIAKGIIEIHKGTISASNKVSGGLKFNIKLQRM